MHLIGVTSGLNLNAEVGNDVKQRNNQVGISGDALAAGMIGLNFEEPG